MKKQTALASAGLIACLSGTGLMLTAAPASAHTASMSVVAGGNQGGDQKSSWGGDQKTNWGGEHSKSSWGGDHSKSDRDKKCGCDSNRDKSDREKADREKSHRDKSCGCEKVTVHKVVHKVVVTKVVVVRKVVTVPAKVVVVSAPAAVAQVPIVAGVSATAPVGGVSTGDGSTAPTGLNLGSLLGGSALLMGAGGVFLRRRLSA